MFVATIVLFSALPLLAESAFVEEERGDYFYFVPEGKIERVLVVAHGTRATNASARETALYFFQQWSQFAQDANLILIVPVFDDDRFGNRGGGGYGGYRGLFGRFMNADDFVIELVRKHEDIMELPPQPFYLYGHSAGGQFAIRFLVQHPELIEQAVVTAPGRYSYPDASTPWPYGAGLLEREIEWNDGTTQSVEVSGDLENYAEAASKVHVIVGGDDLDQQPNRPAHRGETRPELAVTWTSDMNRNATSMGRQGREALASFIILPDTGHNSHTLTIEAQSYLSDQF